MWNSIPGYKDASAGDVQEALGITQLKEGSENNFTQVIGGLIIQGGLTEVLTLDTTATIQFNVAFPKKVLQIHLGPVGDGVLQSNLGVASPFNVTLSQFDILQDGNDCAYYWFAIGF